MLDKNRTYAYMLAQNRTNAYNMLVHNRTTVYMLAITDLMHICWLKT